MIMVQDNGDTVPGHTLSYASRLKPLRALTERRRDQERGHPRPCAGFGHATILADMTRPSVGSWQAQPPKADPTTMVNRINLLADETCQQIFIRWNKRAFWGGRRRLGATCEQDHPLRNP